MNKEFIDYAFARIEKATDNSTEYQELQNQLIEASKNKDIKLYDNLSCQMEAKAEELSYLQGFNDAIQMILNSK